MFSLSMRGSRQVWPKSVKTCSSPGPIFGGQKHLSRCGFLQMASPSTQSTKLDQFLDSFLSFALCGQWVEGPVGSTSWTALPLWPIHYSMATALVQVLWLHASASTAKCSWQAFCFQVSSPPKIPLFSKSKHDHHRVWQEKVQTLHCWCSRPPAPSQTDPTPHPHRGS